MFTFYREVVTNVARVSRKGWAVIPKRLREHLGIRPGDRIAFYEEEGRSVRLVRVPDDPIEAISGMLEGGTSLTADLLADRRIESERDAQEYRSWVARTASRPRKKRAAGS